MLKNYFLTAIRNIKRHKTFSIINIMGLAIGMAVCIMIMLYVKSELSYDKFHKDYDRIFRIEFVNNEVTGEYHAGLLTPAVLAPTLKKEYPEIEEATRILQTSWFHPKVLMKYNDKQFYEESYFKVEPSFFDMFSFSFIYGDAKTAFNNTNSIVLTEELAEKYFGSGNPVGKIINVDNKDLAVTGVLKNIPLNSHMQFRFLTAFSFDPRSKEETTWSMYNFNTYVKLKENFSPAAFAEKMFNLPGKKAESRTQTNFTVRPMTDIHLYSHSKWELGTNGNAGNIYIFSSLALLVLLIACINFMNFSTARSTKRAAEVGLRKVVGADRIAIIKQFLGESIILTLLSFILSIIIILCALPSFNSLAGVNIRARDLLGLNTMPGLLAIVIFTGILAGTYPAVYLSSFQPVNALKKTIQIFGKRNTPMLFRKALVTFQFVITSMLIIGMFVILKQMQFVKNKELGYSKEQILVIPANDYNSANNYIVLKNKLLQNNAIAGATFASSVPDNIVSSSFFFSQNPDHKVLCNSLTVDKDFLSTYDIKLLAGRTVSERSADDNSDQYIINETAAKELNLSSPVGTKLGKNGVMKGEIVGLIKDFHFKSLYTKVGPLVMELDGNPPKYLSLKLNTANLSQTMDFIKNAFYSVFNDRPIDYYFYDDNFDKTYRKEERFVSIVETFAALSIFVSCLGLLGLVSFAVEARRKEIGIRKVLGAEVRGIISLVSMEYLKLIILANIIAMPIAYYIMREWLSDFAYKTNISLWVFALSIAVSFLITIITLGYQTVKAATANPIDSIRYE